MRIDSTFEELRDEAILLSQFYTEARYPDDYIAFSWEDAKKAFEAALRVKEFVVKAIRQREK